MQHQCTCVLIQQKLLSQTRSTIFRAFTSEEFLKPGDRSQEMERKKNEKFATRREIAKWEASSEEELKFCQTTFFFNRKVCCRHLQPAFYFNNHIYICYYFLTSSSNNLKRQQLAVQDQYINFNVKVHRQTFQGNAKETTREHNRISLTQFKSERLVE